MSNKNKQGIDNFLNPKKLFSREKVSYNQIFVGYKAGDTNRGVKGSPNKTHHYHLLPEVYKDSKYENYDPYKGRESAELAQYADNYKNRSLNSSHVRMAKTDGYATPSPQNKQRQQQQTNSRTNTNTNQKSNLSDPSKNRQNNNNTLQSLQQRPAENHRASIQSQSLKKLQHLSRQASFIAVEMPATEQQSPSMQTLVIKSSRKYFDSCRGQALDYITKMEKMLSKQHNFLSESLIKINKYIQQCHHNMAELLKQSLYRIVDESVEQWKTQQIGKLSRQQINYIGQLLELNTQVEERYKQMGGYRQDLDDDKNWKNRASDLLTSNYEGDLMELSKMCKKSAEHSEDNLRQYLDMVMRNTTGRIDDKANATLLADKICSILRYDAQQDKSKHSAKQDIKQDIKKDIKQGIDIKQGDKGANKQQIKQMKAIKKESSNSGLTNKQTYLSPSVKIAVSQTAATPNYKQQEAVGESRKRRVSTICQTCHQQIFNEDPNNEKLNSYSQLRQNGSMGRVPILNQAQQYRNPTNPNILSNNEINYPYRISNTIKNTSQEQPNPK